MFYMALTMTIIMVIAVSIPIFLYTPKGKKFLESM